MGDNVGIDVSTSFLSYSLDVSNCVLHTDISIYLIDTDGSISTTGKVFKLLDASDNSKLSVGTYVKSGATIQPGITRIINKYIHSDGSIFVNPRTYFRLFIRRFIT